MKQYVPPVTWVDNAEDMMKFVRHVRDTGECALDTETTGLDRARDFVVFWSGCPDEQSRYCFSRSMLSIYNTELAKDQDIKWYFTNQTFDFAMMENSGVKAPLGDCYDTLAMDWLYDENRAGRHGLKETAWDHLELNMRPFKEAFKRDRGEAIHECLARYMVDDFEGAISYASLDAWATFRVFHELKRKLQSMKTLEGVCLWDHFEYIEMPFTRVLHNMCSRGIMVDIGYLRELSPQIQKDIDKFQRKLNKAAGKEINPRSPKQLQWLLFDKLGLTPVKYTSGGQSGNRQPSTDEESLRKYSDDGVDVVDLILEVRSLTKTKGTYVDGLAKWVDSEHRIHPTLTQHVTVTGRLSSTDPNLQNIPRPDSDKFNLRGAFMPKDKHVFIVADYEQLEMRLMAHYSGDKNMIDVIQRGWDIHTGTASLMYGFPYEEIKAATKKKKTGAELTSQEKEMCFARQAAKSIGFGLNYGEGPKKLGKTLGVSKDDAMALTRKYFQPYPQVREFIEGVKAFILDHACVETILGRPRRFHDLPEIGKMLRKVSRKGLEGRAKANLAQAERQSVNSVIQGSAADVAKMAMIKAEFDPRLDALGVQMLLQIHDELIFEVPEDAVEKAMPLIRENMEHPFHEPLEVPLDIEAGVGYSWSSAKA